MKITLLLLLSCVLSQGLAQNPAPAKPPNPCEQAIYKAFDFWLGEWEVYGKEDRTGPLLGTNSITKTQGGCLIMEQWTGASGTTGTSMNFYDGTIDQWVQHWVSPGGVSISYHGGLQGDAMVLQGKIYYATQKEHPVRDFKGTWTPLAGGAVKQHFEESIDGGTSWKPWFTGYYFKKDSSAKSKDPQ